MSKFPALLTIATLALALAAPGCRLFRRSSKTIPPPPPPPPPVEASSPKPQPGGEPAKLPPPPQIPAAGPDLSGKPPEPATVQLPPPPRRRGRKKEPQETAVQPPAPPAPPEAQAAQPPPPVPQLEPILTPEQRQAYLEAIDTNVSRAQKALDLLQGRRLDSEQKLTFDRIRAFLQQASEARKTDLFRAKNLAERASVLADDLLRSLQ